MHAGEEHEVTRFEFYSYRKRAAEGKLSDVLIYDELPNALRTQIIHIWDDAIGPYSTFPLLDPHERGYNNEPWERIHRTVAKAHGVLNLAEGKDPADRCVNFLLQTASLDRVLDLIELTFRYIDIGAQIFSEKQKKTLGIRMSADDAITELNKRFLRTGVGYQFENGTIIRIDSELIHSEVVRPTLRYLHQDGFEGPSEEFLRAHEHYRAGRTQEAITTATNAFEGTLKTICTQRKWEYPRGARAAELLKTMRQHRLLPDYLDAAFDQLAATLQSGLPKVRGEQGGHGHGAIPRQTPEYVAAHALHLAAASMLFLIKAHEVID